MAGSIDDFDKGWQAFTQAQYLSHLRSHFGFDALTRGRRLAILAIEEREC
jgi:hypothetical protein